MNPFLDCPVYETEHFIIRKLKREDAEALFPAIRIRMRQGFSMEIAVGMIFIIQIWKNSKNV